jgi:hypothetical protein
MASGSSVHVDNFGAFEVSLSKPFFIWESKYHIVKRPSSFFHSFQVVVGFVYDTLMMGRFQMLGISVRSVREGKERNG